MTRSSEGEPHTKNNTGTFHLELLQKTVVMEKKNLFLLFIQEVMTCLYTLSHALIKIKHLKNTATPVSVAKQYLLFIMCLIV